MKSRIQNMSLISKFIILLITFVFVPIVVISSIIYKEIYKNTIRSETVLRKTNLSNTISSVEMNLREYEKVIDRFYDYDEILKLAYNSNEMTAEMDRDNKIILGLTQMRSAQEYIGSIALLFPDRTGIYSNSGYGVFQYIEDYNNVHMERFLKQMRTPADTIEWRVNDQPDKKRFIVCNKTVKNIYDKYKIIGTIVLHISPTFLDRIEALNGYQQDQLLLMTDCENNIIWTSRSLTGWDEDKLKKMTAEVPGHEKMVLNTYGERGDEYYFIYETSKYTDWNYINLIEKKDILTQVHTFTLFFTIILFIMLLFLTVCIIMMYSSIFRPIQKLIVFMNNVDALDKIEMNIPVERGDEIGYLYKSYNKLNTRISNLIKQLEEAYKEDKNKEIKLLQSQLNPHFIYNTLESISWVTYSRNMPEVSRVLNNLSGILRYSIKHVDLYVTFEKELEMLDYYIYIQHFRFEDRFEVEFDIDESLLKFKTIKFIFQPFVENALVHGFKDMSHGCRIIIRMYREEDTVQIVIQDNGCGMNAYQMEHLRQRDNGGIGVYNIDKALQLRFGQEYSIRIHSAVDRGTEVRIRLPVIF